MEMWQDGVRVYCLPDEASCLKDEDQRSPLDIEECPIGEQVCTGDCFYYSEGSVDKGEFCG